MESGTIKSSQIHVSSASPGKEMDKARLNCCKGESVGAWCPDKSDAHPWYQIDFNSAQAFGGLLFQHPARKDESKLPDTFMKSFALRYKSPFDSSNNWLTYNTDIPSIYNSSTAYNIQLLPPVVATAVRLYPTSYQNAPCFRLELLGCDPKGLCSADFCQNGGECLGKNLCKCKESFYGDRCNQQVTKIKRISVEFTSIIENILRTTSSIVFQIFGNVKLESSSIEKVVHIQGKNSYLQVDKNSTTSCLRDIDSCSSGFTLTLSVKFRILNDNTYIITSGGDRNGFSGISLFYSKGTINYYVTTKTQTWRIQINNTFTLNVWHKIELTWNKILGSQIFDNGKLIGSTSQPLQTIPATQTLPIQIGSSSTNQISTVDFQVTKINIFEANREVLVDNSLLTSTQMPSTIPMPTTTKSYCDSKQNNLTFLSINGNIVYTPSYNFSVYNSPRLTPESDGSAFLELKKKGQYVELPNVGLECIQDMTRCDHGFTLSVEIRFHDLNSTDKLYIFSSGGDRVNSSGIALYLWKGELYCSAKKDKTIWTAKQKLDVNVEEWHTFQVSWNKKAGFIVYLDGNKFMEHGIRLPNPAQNDTHALLIGTSPGYKNTVLMDVRHLYTWSSSRDELIKEGCIQDYTTTPTTTTTTTSTTTAPKIPVFSWVFANITNNMSRVNNISTEFHQVRIDRNENSVTFTNQSQYIDLDTHNIPCLSQLQLCQTGITIKMVIKFTKLNENTVIFTSGATVADNVGIAILYRYGHLHFVVNNHISSWFITIPRDRVILNVYHAIILSWSSIQGLQTVFNNTIIGTTTISIPHTFYNLTTGHTYIGPSPGCSCNTNSGFSIKSLTIFHAWIQICIDGGLLPPVFPETTTAVPATTKPHQTVPPSSSEFCQSGYVCKDTLTTMMPSTTNPTTRQPVTPSPTTTPKPTTKPKPATTPKPTTTTPKPTTTKPKPTVPPYTTVPILIAGNTPQGTPALQCTVSAATSTVELTVCLNVGSIKCMVQKVVSGNTQIIYFTAREVNQNLLNTQVTCSVKARFVGQSIWTATFVSKIFRPIIKIVTPSRITLVEGHYPHFDIHVQSTAPPQMYCCRGCQGHCSVTLTTHIISGRIVKTCRNKLIIPQVLVGWAGESQSQRPEMCGTYISAHKWEHNITIPITATVDLTYDRDHSVVMGVQASITNVRPGSGVSPPIAINVGKITVTAKDNDHRGYCSSLNDPHITTFDGRRYDNFNEGEFILYKHTYLPLEVRGLYRKCSKRSRATCNCAAAVKSGDDVFVFSACSGSSHHGHSIFDILFRRHGHSSKHGLLVDLYKNGELTPGTYIRRYGCGQKYEITLPTGTVVTIQASSRSFLNIYIRPSSLDRHQTEGLCGNFNGNKYDDIDRKYGYKTNERYPNRFCMSWRPSSSIFHGVRPSTLPGITTYCSCTDKKTTHCTHGYGYMICYDTRYDVTRTMIKQAKVPQLTSRGRRSVPTSELSTSLDLFQTEDESLSNDLDEMRDYCRQYIENSTASKMCSSVLNSANYSSRIENCARDMNDTGDKVWAEDSVKDIINECLNEAEKSTPIDDYSTDTPTGSPSDLLEQLIAGLCDQDCGANGQCNAGVCECNEGYTGELCEISKTTKPTVLSSNFDQEACGTCGCDVQETADCSTVVVYGNNFVDSETLTCFYKYVQVSDSVKVVSGFRQVRANFVSLHQVTCDLPEAKGSALVQISNDGTTLSDDVYLHVVYDSRCHDCIVHNETMASNCTQRDNVCIINGVCHTSNENKDNDNCRICEPSTDPYTWTISANKDCASEYLKVRSVEKDDKQPIAVPILAALSAFLGALLIITVFCLCKQSGRGKKAGQTGKYEITANPHVDITKSQDDKL